MFPPRGHPGLQLGPQKLAELLLASPIQPEGLYAGDIVLWGLVDPGQPLPAGGGHHRLLHYSITYGAGGRNM